jgi:hypothetical protein
MPLLRRIPRALKIERSQKVVRASEERRSIAHGAEERRALREAVGALEAAFDFQCCKRAKNSPKSFDMSSFRNRQTLMAAKEKQFRVLEARQTEEAQNNDETW